MEINKLSNHSIPARLRRLSDAPRLLYSSATKTQLESLLQRKCLAVVGSRKVSAYGRQVTNTLVGKVAEQGVVIISGLALGVDAIAHQAALEAGGRTIAVLPSPLEKIYPASHRRLAQQIVEQGGALISEYPEGTPAYRWNFVGRNRLIAGLADATLITEAAEKSGSLHTAGFALEQGKEVLAVPGNITSQTSAGTNMLIKTGGAPITSYLDILRELGLSEHQTSTPIYGRNPEEQLIIDLLLAGNTDGEMIQLASKLDITTFNQTLTMLEISGKIRAVGANHWALA